MPFPPPPFIPAATAPERRLSYNRPILLLLSLPASWASVRMGLRQRSGHSTPQPGPGYAMNGHLAPPRGYMSTLAS